MNKNLAKILNEMAVIDQKMRRNAMKTGIWDKTIDRKNTLKIKEIIKKFGWPTINLVGKKASRNAWLLVQHTNHDVKFQRKCLKLIENIYKINPNLINKTNIAYLKDRVLINKGNQQLFGTQFYTNKEGIFGPRPIKDIKNLDKRRKEYHLPPFSEYKKLIKSYKSALIKKVIK
ncbi:MAG: hypothetical protein UT92_C0001G0017 [Candidatus Curtissbacteria bacterium GW2011_GWA1_40_24]|uniref:Uncharacterized protein n=2 Tax=Patescibacteria group TaxID=1783273 RepID=A0A0G0RSN7_9BACT|nr:MAG: hypothetical protein UT92_C0001G0017 [Candidatus Curtissbacteria bacterium GW2011_GWA1_40_24]KKR89014.1 MAG: hypothetical protein UU38_C0002G0017 [Candidatus Wolfebacteria bacterium GW2011_GWB1_41_12]